MIAEPDERTLIQSAQQGDLDAFNVLVDRYQALLFRIAVRILGDEDLAADAAQTAWISAFQHIGALRGWQLRAWLVRMVVNACYDELRRRHRRREMRLPRNDKNGAEIDSDCWLADPAPGVEELADMSEFERAVLDSLQFLVPEYRSMLVLVDIEGLSYEEAARAAGVPLGTVRSRLARARLAMRAHLGQFADLSSTPLRFPSHLSQHDPLRYP